VPGDSFALTDVQQEQLLGRVVRAFERYPFVGQMKPVPTSYLRAGGGFGDLERVAQLFGLDVLALLSYDQVQFTEKTRSSIWYWTLVGAYLAQGDQYDVHTLLEATVVDVRSRRLLFRAAGTSVMQGGATVSNVAETTRAARGAGFDRATEQLIVQLQGTLEAFRTRARAGAEGGVQLQLPPGYDPAATNPAGAAAGAPAGPPASAPPRR
jgi:rhombotail lipoprotein